MYYEHSMLIPTFYEKSFSLEFTNISESIAFEKIKFNELEEYFKGSNFPGVTDFKR